MTLRAESCVVEGRPGPRCDTPVPPLPLELRRHRRPVEEAPGVQRVLEIELGIVSARLEHHLENIKVTVSNPRYTIRKDENLLVAGVSAIVAEVAEVVEADTGSGLHTVELLVHAGVLGWGQRTLQKLNLRTSKLGLLTLLRTRKIVEGTRGPFYTIGRSSLPAADTLRRRRRKRRRKLKNES